MANDPSAIASMLTRSDVLSALTASFTGIPSFPAGGQQPQPTGGGAGAAPTQMAITSGQGSGTSGGTGSTPGGSGTSNRRVLSTNGRPRRTVDLDEEVEYIEEWGTEVACSTENAGKRTNATGATIRFEIASE